MDCGKGVYGVTFGPGKNRDSENNDEFYRQKVYPYFHKSLVFIPICSNKMRDYLPSFTSNTTSGPCEGVIAQVTLHFCDFCFLQFIH